MLGLENLQIIGDDSQQPYCSPLAVLSQETLRLFKNLPGYDTLRLVLSRAAILVEGPSDELIVQLAYMQTHDSKLNWNTLEAEMLRKNGFERLKSLLGRRDDNKARLLKYIEGNKTDAALNLFDASASVLIPDFINDGIGWLDEQCR